MIKKILISIISLGIGLIVGMIAMIYIVGNVVEKYKKLSDKHLRLFILMNKWVKLQQDGKHISEYLKKLDVENVAIYGMSYVGITLAKELKNAGYNIRYVIDENSDKKDIPYKLVNPNDKLEVVDVIIVTPIYYFEEIEYSLRSKAQCPIISIEDIINSF